ncbi:hypothetical protein ACA910_016319 [Epithemia clementina (nom. ined.)]
MAPIFDPTATAKRGLPPGMSKTKRLAGINSTSELESLVKESIALVTMTNNEDRLVTVTVSATKARPMTLLEARTILQDYDQSKRQQGDLNSDKENYPLKIRSEASSSSIEEKPLAASSVEFIPIPVLRAAGLILSNDPMKFKALEMAIRGTSLVFTSPSQTNSSNAELEEAERKRFRKRLERLRLKQEEHKYSKLTRNVYDQKAVTQNQDEVTTKSMTYAASIGLNMIVAPLSFGCFMYYFSGNLLGWIFTNDNMKATNTVDIRRVIVSVLSGVIMLFIEMLLFVIRTHEVDKAMRSKQRRQQKKADGTSQAFSYYTAHSERHYKDS